MSGRIVELKDRLTLQEQARAWLMRLDADTQLSDPERDELREWLAQSPAHRLELVRIARLWQGANVLTQLAPHLRKPASGRPFGLDTQRAAWAGALLLLVAVGSLVPGWIQQRRLGSNGVYAAALGEHKSFTLADGTVLDLNSASEVRVEYSATVRDVRLLRGEVHFNVAHDARHPFETYAGVDLIRAVGTAFSVYLHDEQVRVTVDEGRVAIGSMAKGPPADDSTTTVRPVGKPRSNGANVRSLGSLVAGQSATLNDAGAKIRILAAADLEGQMAWRKGLLVFSGEPLSQFVAEVSRYTPVSIEIADPALNDLPIGGRFRIDDFPAILDALESSFPIRVERVDSGHVRLLPAGP